MMRQFDDVIGLSALKAIHLNDSKTELVGPLAQCGVGQHWS